MTESKWTNFKNQLSHKRSFKREKIFFRRIYLFKEIIQIAYIRELQLRPKERKNCAIICTFLFEKNWLVQIRKLQNLTERIFETEHPINRASVNGRNIFYNFYLFFQGKSARVDNELTNF